MGKPGVTPWKVGLKTVAGACGRGARVRLRVLIVRPSGASLLPASSLQEERRGVDAALPKFQGVLSRWCRVRGALRVSLSGVTSMKVRCVCKSPSGGLRGAITARDSHFDGGLHTRELVRNFEWQLRVRANPSSPGPVSPPRRRDGGSPMRCLSFKEC